MDSKQREIVQRLVEDGIVRPPSMYRTGRVEIRVDNSLPHNVWVMTDQTRIEFLKFLHHQHTIAERMKRMKLREFQLEQARRIRHEPNPI